MLNQRVILSNWYNMSLGFLPMVFTMIMCELTEIPTAFYIGTAISVVASFAVVLTNQVPSLMLHVCTAILMCFSLMISIFGAHWQYADIPISAWSPFLLEIGIAIPLTVLFVFRHQVLAYLRQPTRKLWKKAYQNLMIQALESTLIAIRVLLFFIALHILLLTGLVMASVAVESVTAFIVFRILPPLIFIVTIIFNQYGLHYFNRVMSQTNYIAVVDKRGHVKGKVPEMDAPLYKNALTNAVVRVIPIYQGMLYISRRPANSMLDPGKMDTPLESYIHYGEKVQDTLNRILKSAFPNGETLKPHFVVRHVLRNEEASRMIYLYTLEVPDGTCLQGKAFEDGKLWTIAMLDKNVQMNYFGASLEAEYKLLRAIIDTKEKYRES